MQVKRFTADTLEGAVDRVKEEFGDEALIIETRRVRGGVLRFWRRPGYEVVAALETPGPAPKGGRPTKSLNGRPDPLLRLQTLLLAQGLPEASVKNILRATRSRLDEKPGPVQWEQILEAAAAYMEQDLICVGPEPLLQERGVVVFVGPTGVGKTTTLAKLAANFSLLGGRRVVIVTTDTQRLGAVEALRTYAELIEVPMEVADTPERLSTHVNAHSDKDLILVDTPGCNPYVGEELRSLQSFLDALDRPRTYLVVSATTKPADLFELSWRFARLGYERIVVTKVDETRTYGALYMLGASAGKPLAYLTTGQAVPEDIEVADPEGIVRLVLNGNDLERETGTRPSVSN